MGLIPVADKNLTTLTLFDYGDEFGPHLKDLFDVLKSHAGLRALQLKDYLYYIDPELVHLKNFLTQNRHIEVTIAFDTTLNMDKEALNIMAFNRFFRGSLQLRNELVPIRPLFMGAALTETACTFQRIGLLLSDHVDVLCELVYEVVLPTVAGGES